MEVNAKDIKKHKTDGFTLGLEPNQSVTFGDTVIDANEVAFHVMEVSENILHIVSSDSRFEKFPVPPFQVYKSALSK